MMTEESGSEDALADITERLRRAAPFLRASGYGGIVGQHADICEEAADEIKRLRSVEETLRDLEEGRAVILPGTREHAEKMLLVADACLKAGGK